MGIINARFLDEKQTGVGRFSFEVTKRLRSLLSEIEIISTTSAEIPPNWQVKRKGFSKGAFWEQLQLPFFIPRKAKWCFNPANTCSLTIRNNVTVIHDIIPLTNPEWYSFQARIYYRILMPLVIKRSRVIITVSEANKIEINKLLGTPLYKIKVVANAVDDFWRPVHETTLYNNYILTVGSLDPRKNLKRLIQAFLRLDDSTLILVIVGHKHKAFADQDLTLSFSEMSRIVFTGYVDDEQVRRLYSHARLFVYPSLKEGFGIPPLEAMKCECPVIASSIPSVKEVCADAVEYIINPYDVSSIYESMQKLLNDEQKSVDLKAKGLLRASLFDWDDTTYKIAQILQSVEK